MSTETQALETFLQLLEEQGRQQQLGQPVAALPAPVEDDPSFLDVLTTSLISEGVLDTIRDQGFFGRIGANVLGELTNPIGIASTALLATGVGAPLGAGLRIATQGTRLAAAGRLGAGALTPVAQSARGLGPTQILARPGLAARSLAAEAAVAGGAIGGGGVAQELGQGIPGPTRSTAGQIALGLAGGAVGGGLTAGAFNRVLDQDAALQRAFAARDSVEEKIPELFQMRSAFREAARAEADIINQRTAGRARGFELSDEAEANLRASGVTDPDVIVAERRAARGGRIVDRARFQPLATEVNPNLSRRGDTIRIADITEQGAQFGVSRDLIRKVGERAFEIHGPKTASAENAIDAFSKLLLGEVPNPSERRLLRPVIGDAFINQIETVIGGRRQRALRLGMEIAGVPRTLAGSFDVSSVLRQGGPLNVAHPKAALRAWRTGFKALRNEKYAMEVNKAQVNHRLVNFFNSGLEESDQVFIQNLDDSVSISRREENFISPLVSKVVPGVRHSERFFATNLNSTRIGFLERRFKMLEEQFPELLRPENAVRLQEFRRISNRQVNMLTGRGSLGPLEFRRGSRDSVEAIRTALSVGFWSPRLLMSRIQAPLEAIRSSGRIATAQQPEIRALSKSYARDIATYVGGVMAAIGALSLLDGVSVEGNPKSSDFGKVRVGNTRIDPWAGFQQIGRYATQFVTGERKRAIDGQIGPTDRDRVLGQFLRSKLAPGPVSILASDLPRNFVQPGLTGGGTNFINEPITGGDVTPGPAATFASLGQATEIPAELNVLVDQMVPLLAQDITDALEEDGLIPGTVAAFGSAFGLGSTTFGEGTGVEFVREEEDRGRNDSNRARQVANAAFR